MITNENKKLAQWAMEYALKNGCQSSRVTLYNGSSSSFEIRDMKIDRLQQASENSMVVHLFVDGRYGSYSTNRLDKKELEKFIKDGISATRFLARCRTLPCIIKVGRRTCDWSTRISTPCNRTTR